MLGERVTAVSRASGWEEPPKRKGAASMRTTMMVRGFAAVALLAGLVAIGPAPALALCGGDVDAGMVARWSADPLQAVFVGTAVETRSDGYSALFEVKEVWGSGQVSYWQPVVAPVEGAWFEDHPIWHTGETYLVLAHRRGSVFLSQSCTSVYPPTAYEDLRPAKVSQPVANSRPFLWAWRSLLAVHWRSVVLVLAVVLIGAGWIAWLVRRERRRPPTSREEIWE